MIDDGWTPPYRSEAEFVRGQKLKLLIALVLILVVLLTGCEYFVEPQPADQTECTGRYIVGVNYGRVDTLGIIWDRSPPWCKYPPKETMWDGHIVKKP